MKKIWENSNDFLDAAKNEIIIFDGGMGSLIMEANLSEADFGGHAGCNEYISISKPEVISSIHARYFEAGARVVETNTFGGASHILSEHGLAAKTFEINNAAAKLAKKEAEKYSKGKFKRFVAGSMGPGSKLPSLGDIGFGELKLSYIPQAEGLFSGGVDCFIVETSQDLLQIKAAISAIAEVLNKHKAFRPTIAQVTLDQNGKTLTGSDISAVLATLEAWPVSAIGMNCGLGPEGLMEAAQYLSKNSSKLLSIMPNAGLPRVFGGKTQYTLSPEDFASQMSEIVKNIGANIIGGCCGTTPKHIELLIKAIKGLRPRKPLSVKRPALASLYQAQDMVVLPRPLIIGERANANGSKQFRERLQNGDFDGVVTTAIAQETEGAHVLDLSVALAGRDEKKDMGIAVKLLNTRTRLSLMIDSTDPDVIENALKNISGRAVVNSINLEDGGKKAKRIIDICAKYGAAVVILAIDENGMALSKNEKIKVIKRLVYLAKDGGLREEDLLIDSLTFTLTSGERKFQNAAVETLSAIKEINKLWPFCHTILGVSNISYGLLPNVRRVLNSVFLKRAIEHGLTSAILHAAKIMPLHLIPPKALQICDDLIFNRRDKGMDPLEELIKYFSSHKESFMTQKEKKNASAEAKLEMRIVNGNSEDMENILKETMKKRSAMEVINDILLPAMNEVGDFFRKGEKQLPFVLRSAEIMRMATTFLQPFLGKEAKNKGLFVLATVRGDIHDIGKNLVDIIFSANGYKVINLGVRQSAENIIVAAKQHRPAAIGLSGLLVESVKAMKEYLPIFKSAGISIPVVCGGAALTHDYVREEMMPLYDNNVHYAKDAIDGLKLLDEISKKPSTKVFLADKSSKRVKVKTLNLRKPITVSGVKSTIITKIPLKEIYDRIDRKALFMRRWQLLSLKDFNSSKKKIAENKLKKLWLASLKKKLWRPKAVYGFFKANIRDGQIHIHKSNSNKELLRLEFSRKIGGKFLEGVSGTKEIALQIVTAGHCVKKETVLLGKKKKIEDQFLLHGLAAEFCEATAKWCNEKVANKRGWKSTRRLSPGYPIWPSLTEQEKIFALLSPHKIGVKLTETLQMEPEFSTSAIVLSLD